MPDNANHGLERLVFFSDVVIAVAITRLVLNLRLPYTPGESLAAQLRGLTPEFVSFAISFAVIGLFWEAHHRVIAH